MQILGAWRNVGVVAFIIFSVAALPASSAPAQSRVDIAAPGMPEEMKPQIIPLDNGTVRQSDPAQQPAPAIMDVPNGQLDTYSTANAPPALTPQQLDYLKDNTATMQPAVTPSTAEPKNAYQPPAYYGSQVTGFTPQPQQTFNGVVGLPAKQLDAITQSKPSQAILDYMKTASKPFATDKAIVSSHFATFANVLGYTADGAAVVSEYQKSGALAGTQKLSEVVAVHAASTAAELAAAPLGPNASAVAGATTGVLTKATVDVGTKVVAPKIADGWLWADKKFGLTATGRALQQGDRNIQDLQRRVDAARLNKLQAPPASGATSIQASIPVPTSNAAAAATAVLPAATLQTQPNLAQPAVRSNPALPAPQYGQYMTTTTALQKKTSLQSVRPLTSRIAVTSPPQSIPGSSNVATLSPNPSNAASPSIYTFKKTPYGTVETFKNGQRIATTTPDYATQRYGYNRPARPAGQMNLSGFGVTQKDIATAKSAPQVAATTPTDTDFGSAPGKPANATNPEPKETHRSNVRRSVYRPPPQRYRYVAPRVNCAQLQMQFRMAVQNTGFGIDPNLYSSSAMLDRYCGGAR